MNFKQFLGACLLLGCSSTFSAECTLYETMHPLYPLTGAHLSTGKCQSCGQCHIRSIFNGTPRSCVTCHNGDPSRLTVGRPLLHIPTNLVECDFCHKTVSFATSVTMNHPALGVIKCIACHSSTSPRYLGNQQRMSITHNQKTPVPLDCSQVGCHRPLGTKGSLYRSWD
jgi:hypothetical protein